MTGYKGTLDSKTYERILKEVIKNVADYSNSESDIADLGCHDDYMLSHVIRCKTYTLVDKEIVRNYDCYAEKVKFYEMDVNKFVKLAIKDGLKYDVIIMSSLVEHLNLLERYELFSNIRDIMKDGGLLIVTYPNCRSINRVLGVHMGMIPYFAYLSEGDKKLGHKTMFSHKELDEFAKISKLRIIKKQGIMFKPLPLSMMDKYFSDVLDRFIEIGKSMHYEHSAMILGVFRK